MPSLLAEFIALLAYGPLIVLLHEAGHALFARRGGYRVTSFGVGLGKPVWSLSLGGGVVFHIDRWFFAGGACVAIPSAPPTARRLWFHGGGLLVQSGLAAFLLLLPDHWLINRVEQFNLLVALTNLIPWAAAGQASDGWYILDALKGSRHLASVLPQREALERMGAQEAALGSTMGQAYADLCLAWADVLAGRTEDAAWFFLDDPPQTAAEPWVDALYHYVRAEWHRHEGRPLAALHTVHAGRASLGAYQQANALLALAEARALVELDAPRQAQRMLAYVAGSHSTVGRQASTVLLWAHLDEETTDLEMATWRVARHIHEPGLDPADTVLALWEASHELADRGRILAAQGARRAAEELASAVLQAVGADDAASLRYLFEEAITGVDPQDVAVPERER